MKESLFNLLLPITKDSKKYNVFFNTLYGSATLVDDNFALKNIKQQDKQTIQILQTNKHFIEDEINELDLIRSQNKLQRFNERTLELTILPTMNCNLYCQYCYENRKNITMTDSNIQTIYKFIKNKIHHINALSILWFGGEPLLATRQIENLSKKIISLTSKHNVRFRNSIITNGTLLSDEICKKLIRCAIKDVQITLDGPPTIHNKRKPMLDGQGSFDLIFKHLCSATSYFKALSPKGI